MTKLEQTCASFVRVSVPLVVSAMLAACTRTQGSTAPSPVETPQLQVHTTKLSIGPITRSITLPAQVLPDQQATLYAKVSGYLQAINVDKGDHVRSGAVLARIEVPELLASRAKEQAELRAADAEYGRLQESLQRAPDLVVPQMVDQARGRVEIARASLEQSETMLRYGTITAPFSGVITQRYVDSGTLIQAGTSSGAAIVTLMDFSKVRLQLAVPELEASRVAIGQPVSVTTENLAAVQFSGKVTRFAYALDPSSRTMLAEAGLENPRLILRPGMLVTVKLGLERHENAAIVSTDALVMEKANAFVYVVEGGKAVKRPVRIGFNDGKNIEILEGVSPSDTIILVGKAGIANGQPIRVAALQ
jgi:membrane fusion protein (multidrug efflux system)